MRRFLMTAGMHMGPMKRCVNKGDVLGWDAPTKIFTLNGIKLFEEKGMSFAETIAILERQMAKDPEKAWSKELAPVITPVGLDTEIKSDSQVILTILGCLQAIEDFLGTHQEWEKLGKMVNWTPANEDQYQFLRRFIGAKSLVDTLGDNLKRKADLDVNVINAWLKENGFDIQLDAMPGTAFAVASILDVLVEWVKEGDVTTVYNEKGTFPAVSLKSEHSKNVKMFINRGIYPFPVAQVETKNGDKVFMSVLDHMPNEAFALSDKVTMLQTLTNETNNIEGCSGVIFPMINYDKMVNIGWIVGMQTGNDEYYISEALQQTKFRMNEMGARAQSAVAMSMRCGAMAEAAPWVRIDKPFVLWIERPGVALPLFIGVFAEDVWKKPADLK